MHAIEEVQMCGGLGNQEVSITTGRRTLAEGGGEAHLAGASPHTSPFTKVSTPVCACLPSADHWCAASLSAAPPSASPTPPTACTALRQARQDDSSAAAQPYVLCGVPPRGWLSPWELVYAGPSVCWLAHAALPWNAWTASSAPKHCWPCAHHCAQSPSAHVSGHRPLLDVGLLHTQVL